MKNVKNVLVTGAGGFIGHHLVKHLKRNGCWVRGVDLKRPEYAVSDADDYKMADLRKMDDCLDVLKNKKKFDEVYHLAADMGGMGYIHSSACDIMRNSGLMNSNMVDACAKGGIQKYFFSSSVCVYRDMKIGEPEIKEEDAYPAFPDNEYGWEKLFAERMALAYAKDFKMNVKIARFQNCYGPEGTWRGGREKAPAAICRKVAEAPDGGTIEIWGDGTAVRSFIYVDDLINAILCLMRSDIVEPTNIGGTEYVTVSELTRTVLDIARKDLKIKYVEGPVGVRSRNFSNARIVSTGWRPQYSLKEGLSVTYSWIKDQIKK